MIDYLSGYIDFQNIDFIIFAVCSHEHEVTAIRRWTLRKNLLILRGDSHFMTIIYGRLAISIVLELVSEILRKLFIKCFLFYTKRGIDNIFRSQQSCFFQIEPELANC